MLMALIWFFAWFACALDWLLSEIRCNIPWMGCSLFARYDWPYFVLHAVLVILIYTVHILLWLYCEILLDIAHTLSNEGVN